VEDRERAIGVFVYLNGQLDEMQAKALLGDLQHPPLIAHAVGIADDALVGDAQDVARGAEERHEGAALFGRGHRKAAVVPGNVDLPQVPVGRLDRRDPMQPQHRRQPLLQGAEHSSHAAACFRAMGWVMLDLRLRRGAASAVREVASPQRLNACESPFTPR
jgi:hypothetical protein